MDKIEKIDPGMIANSLGAKIVEIPEITEEQAEQYLALGSPVMLVAADKLYIYHLGSRMLQGYGLTLDAVVGYRILGADEETDFREKCSFKGQVVKYYGAGNKN